MLSENGAPGKIAVVGAGPMGLAVAYELAKRGCAVTVFERDDRVGGMSASVDFAGTRLERYYHFVCRTDTDLFAYLDELGLAARLKWATTQMSYYYQGKTHAWGTPFALATFPGLSLLEKARYAAHVLHTKRITDWAPYDKLSATEWLKKWLGQRAYETVWDKLFHYKFYELKDELSAAWIGTRIKRVALSRENLFTEQLGYIDGGSELLLQEMAGKIADMGGTIALGTKIDEVVVEAGRVHGIRHGTEISRFDQVISTIPMPYLTKLVPKLPKPEQEKLARIRNVGVVCVLVKLRKQYSKAFWLNINDPRIEIPGIIEYTNLNTLDLRNGESIIYAPYYMPQTNEKYGRPAEAFIEETLQALELMKPSFNRADVLCARASRYEYAQTVCSVGFFHALVPMASAVKGLFLADTSHCYPEDRSISESFRVARQLVQLSCQQGAEDVPG